jgi:tetratricopeptide (TPR) repeat protein
MATKAKHAGSTGESPFPLEPSQPARSRAVYCFYMDMIGSTQVLLGVSNARLDRFNEALVNQIKPHLQGLGLEESVVKFTGDGWLVMTDQAEKIPSLSCLALIMATRFQDEMCAMIGGNKDDIPPLRLAICEGRDIEITAFGGGKDWVGDSARMAVRASGYCDENLIIIDETISKHIRRDFTCAVFNKSKAKSKPKHEEEDLVLYALSQLKPPSVTDPFAPQIYVYTLHTLGQQDAAVQVAVQYVEEMQEKAPVPKSDLVIIDDTAATFREAGIVEPAKQLDKITRLQNYRRSLRSWNTLLASAKDYSEALSVYELLTQEETGPDVYSLSIMMSKSPDAATSVNWMQEMIRKGIEPNVVTYNTLINKADTFADAEKWTNEMIRKGIEPNVVTYNTLINKADTFADAEKWTNEMIRKGIEPDVVTYSTLINKADTFADAEKWTNEMIRKGIEPDVVTYNTLINKADTFADAEKWTNEMIRKGIEPEREAYSALYSKNLTTMTAEQILERVLTQKRHRETSINAAIASFRKILRPDHAVRLARDYTHLESARKLIRELPKETIRYFREFARSNPEDPNASYSLGIAYIETGERRKALPYLQKALTLATAGKRKENLQNWISEIEKEVGKE